VIGLASIGLGCQSPGSNLAIPSCPVPSLNERAAIQMAADVFPDTATLERRRIVHCCRLEVLKELISFLELRFRLAVKSMTRRIKRTVYAKAYKR